MRSAERMEMRAAALLLVASFALLGCPGKVAEPGSDAGLPVLDGGATADAGTADGGVAPDAGEASDSGFLSARYPCDQGIASDPSVVWYEGFEEGSVSAFAARYDQVDDSAGMALSTDHPLASCTSTSLGLTSGGSVNATDFYKQLPDADELYVRWYAKYQAGVPWHHTGMWFGGYNPGSAYPYINAGTQPSGSQLVMFAIEPIWGVGMPDPKLDFYNYWMNMHTCSSCGGSYWGNALVNHSTFTADDDAWMCLEVHVKLNVDVSSASGAVLEVWKNDALVQSYPETAGTGYWVQDHFCPVGADINCNYSPTAAGPLDIQFRDSSSLHLNAFWPQNYITSTSTGTVWFDEMVVATTRIGCEQP